MPLQLGSTNTFHVIKKHPDDVSSNILFLDAATYPYDIHLSAFDVPNLFYTVDVAELYYKSLCDFANENKVSIYIRQKDRGAKSINQEMEKIIEINDGEKQIHMTEPDKPLQDVIEKINPKIVLIRPMSSTYLFVRKMGCKPYFYIPHALQTIYDKVEEFYISEHAPFKQQWVNESKLHAILSH